MKMMLCVILLCCGMSGCAIRAMQHSEENIALLSSLEYSNNSGSVDAVEQEMVSIVVPKKDVLVLQDLVKEQQQKKYAEPFLQYVTKCVSAHLKTGEHLSFVDLKVALRHNLAEKSAYGELWDIFYEHYDDSTQVVKDHDKDIRPLICVIKQDAMALYAQRERIKKDRETSHCIGALCEVVAALPIICFMAIVGANNQ